jgi:glutathione S-transferase
MSNPSRYQLFYSLRSPFARRVRVAMQRQSISFEPKIVNVFEPTAEFLKTNPLGLVPALVVSDKPGESSSSFTIADSATILEYLHENHGGRVWPADLQLRARVRAASTLAEGLMTETVRWFLENTRPSPSAEWTAESIENIDRTLRAICASPLNTAPWKISDIQMTQAGYDLVVALEYMRLRLEGYDWEAKFPDLTRFLDLHRVRQDLASSAPTL